MNNVDTPIIRATSQKSAASKRRRRPISPTTHRIGEVAEKLGVATSVLRFWEHEFSLKSPRTAGGQRFYTMSEVEKLTTIRELLYRQKLTIAGAKQVLAHEADPSPDIMKLKAELLRLRAHLES